MSLTQRVRLEIEGRDDMEVVYDGRDLRAWEVSFSESSLSADMSVSMLTWLGHHAAVRTGVLNGELKSWKAFDEVCVSVQGLRDEEAPPTKRGRSTPKTVTDGSSAP